jgi:predicted dehydrogenase
MKTIKIAVFGTGFMGRVHTEAARRLGFIEVAGVAGSSLERARAFATRTGVPRAEADYRKFLADPEIDAVHILTPNHLHFPMAKDALLAGKNVVCEKPLATSVAEGEELVALGKKTGLANCTFHNVRMYPQVQNMKAMVEAGEIGEVRVIQGTYSQDWLLYDTDWNWRIEVGPSRTFADIGSHWCDLAEHVTGLRLRSVCADLKTFYKTRKKPKGPVETFAGKTLRPDEYTEVPIETEDFGSMIFRMDNDARGAMTVSQISAGRKNRLVLEIYGTKKGVAWDCERQDELWIGERNEANRIVIKDPALLEEKARPFADLPGGHSEGYDDTFKQIFRRFYARVADRAAAIDYPTFEDGLRQLKVLDTVLESSRTRAWAEVKG